MGNTGMDWGPGLHKNEKASWVPITQCFLLPIDALWLAVSSSCCYDGLFPWTVSQNKLFFKMLFVSYFVPKRRKVTNRHVCSYSCWWLSLGTWMRQGNHSSDTFPTAQTRSGNYCIMCSWSLWGVTPTALTTSVNSYFWIYLFNTCYISLLRWTEQAFVCCCLLRI